LVAIFAGLAIFPIIFAFLCKHRFLYCNVYIVHFLSGFFSLVEKTANYSEIHCM
jgi:hypothetical protein